MVCDDQNAADCGDCPGLAHCEQHPFRTWDRDPKWLGTPRKFCLELKLQYIAGKTNEHIYSIYVYVCVCVHVCIYI